jgi:Capsule assembly protein Wzi
MRFRILPLVVAGLLTLAGSATASPWAEVGDAQLRSDIEVLAAAGVIDDITTQWPLPWASIVSDIRHAPEQASPMVRAAMSRVMAAARHSMRFDELHASVAVDGSNAPSVVYGFDGMGRETAQGQASLEYVGKTTAARLSLGAERSYHGGKVSFEPDNSYIAQKIGGAVVYGGYLTHWWGPGWISALSLSNNARPMPQIGIARGETGAFETPWLSWLGPWQGEFFVGVLNGPRIARNTVYSALRFTFNPAPGLEIGLARTDQMCGTGHPCQPLNYYFEFSNDPSHVNHTNDEGLIDVKYSSVAYGYPFEVYIQLMNEDSNPISHSITSHLYGASLWVPIGENPLRLTAEYADSVPTLDIFSFGNVVHGDAYNNGGYPDGMRYRGRTLGFSLDSDSQLLTVQGSWLDARGWRYQLSYHRAWIASALTPPGLNVVTTAPVKINLGEFRVSIPFDNFRFDVAARIQDDQPRPWHGTQGALEAAITYDL